MTTSGTSTDKLQLLIQDVNTLLHKLISEGTLASQSELAPSQDVVEAVRSTKASLTVAITSVKGSSPLAERENVSPNQYSWIETAECMGIKKAIKHHQLPEEAGLTQKALALQRASTAGCIPSHMEEGRDQASWLDLKRSWLPQIRGHAPMHFWLYNRLWLTHPSLMHPLLTHLCSLRLQ